MVMHSAEERIRANAADPPKRARPGQQAD